MIGISLYQQLSDAAADASVITLRAGLISGTALPGDERQLVFPSTYAEVGHLCSPVREDGSHEYVLIDSTQSWANRLEEVADDLPGLPRLEVDVAGQTLSAYKLPHRIYDATLRDSELDSVPFRKTELGESLTSARPDNATALLRHAPSVLLFGGWDSFAGIKVGQAKWPAALSGQILGFDATLARKAGLRSDPLGITLDQFRAYQAADPAQFWTLDEDKAARDDKGKAITLKPSEVGHGNILAALVHRGAWVKSMELRGALSLTRLRRYHFPVNGKASPESDQAARTLLVCLAVLLLAERLERGLDLRAGAELDVTDIRFSIRHGLSGDTPIEITVEAARQAMQEAREQAARLGLDFAGTTRFKASERLEKLFQQAVEAS
jgi:CRISPR-associated protein Csb1